MDYRLLVNIFRWNLSCMMFHALFSPTIILGQQADDSPSSLMIGPPPMIMDEIDPHCWNFTYGNWRIQEFYTPNYPGEYLNNTDCVLYLEAPPGFKIHLDFRDKFILEKSDGCKYDFLEVRDGPFAYSPVISRYCGAEFPPIITSSGRFLWMRFKTDDVLQYGGFRAVYSYHKDNTQNDGPAVDKVSAGACRIPVKVTFDEADGFLSSDDVHVEARSDDPSVAKGQTLDCTWEIYSDKGYRIHLRSSELEMNHRKRCDLHNITVYERTTLDSAAKESFCRSQNEILDIASDSNRVFVRLFGSSLNNKPHLRLTYTLVRKGDCSVMEFKCGEVCIPAGLLCNGVDNCRDRSDEKGCTRTRPSQGRGGSIVGGTGSGIDVDGAVKRGGGGGEITQRDNTAGSANNTNTFPLYIIIAGIIGGVLLTCASISVCVMCRLRRKKRDQRQDAARQKSTQRNALEMAVTSSSNTTQSLSRQNNESQGIRQGALGDRQHYVTFSKVNPVAPTPIKDSSHRYSLTEHGLTSLADDTIPDQMTESGNYKRFLAMDMDPDIMNDSLHQHLQGIYPVSPATVMGMTNLDYRMTDSYQGYHGNQWHPSAKDDAMMYPYSPSGSSPFLGISKSFSYSQPESKFESKYLKSLKAAKDSEAIKEYQGS